MNTKRLPNHIVDCAVQLALYTVPGMAETDKDALEAYKALATDMLLAQPRRSWQRLFRHRNKSTRQQIIS